MLKNNKSILSGYIKGFNNDNQQYQPVKYNSSGYCLNYSWTLTSTPQTGTI